MTKSQNCVCTGCGAQRLPVRRLTLPDGTRTNLCDECRDPELARTCKKCSVAQPLENFYPHQRKDQHKLSRSATCKSCVCAQKRIEQPIRRLKRYGLSDATYDGLIEDQDGKCAGCGVSQGRNAWHIDHDHACCPGEKTCGKCVRGLLCRDCNLALGHAREDIGRLLGLADYLAGFRGNGNLPVNQFSVRRSVATGT